MLVMSTVLSHGLFTSKELSTLTVVPGFQVSQLAPYKHNSYCAQAIGPLMAEHVKQDKVNQVLVFFWVLQWCFSHDAHLPVSFQF